MTTDLQSTSCTTYEYDDQDNSETEDDERVSLCVSNLENQQVQCHGITPNGRPCSRTRVVDTKTTQSIKDRGEKMYCHRHFHEQRQTRVASITWTQQILRFLATLSSIHIKIIIILLLFLTAFMTMMVGFHQRTLWLCLFAMCALGLSLLGAMWMICELILQRIPSTTLSQLVSYLTSGVSDTEEHQQKYTNSIEEHQSVASVA